MSGENAVELEPAELAAEADALELPEPEPVPGEAPADGADLEGQGGALTIDQAEALAASYEAGAYVLYSQAARIVAPNWGVTDLEARELAKATAVALAHWFPDQQLPPKYAALLALGGVAFGIVEARRDPATGQVRPMKAPAERAAAGSQLERGEPARTGGGFSTGA